MDTAGLNSAISMTAFQFPPTRSPRIAASDL
jgi:hypothetical protein